jgi:hypothetical protein
VTTEEAGKLFLGIAIIAALSAVCVAVILDSLGALFQ